MDAVLHDLALHWPLYAAMPFIAALIGYVTKRVAIGMMYRPLEVVEDVRDNLDEVLDVQHMTVQRLTRDKALLVRLIRETSRPEMAFIARMGVYFGFGLGLVQTVVWALTREPWVLPVFGGVIGLCTDWLAIKLIFVPREPVRVGRVILQGKFQRRRAEVARQYGELIANEVLTVQNLLDAVLRGPRSDRLAAMVEQMVSSAVDSPLARTGGGTRLRAMTPPAGREALGPLAEPGP